MRRRVWSELLAHRELKGAVLEGLAQRGIELLFAVTPAELASAAGVVRSCRAAGVRSGVWPLLEMGRGRWASELTAPEMAAFAERLMAHLAEEGALPEVIALDLEPPWEVLAEPGAKSFARLVGPRPAGGAELLAGVARAARGRGVEVLCAAMPMVLFDGPARRWQRLCATPVAAVGGALSAMIYTSLVEGYSRGLFRRDDARALLGACALQARARGAGVSLGAIGTGSLGDEPVYRSPAELAEDVAIARAAGVDDLALFSLCGALRRPPLGAWLDAFVKTPAARALPESRRARFAVAVMRAVGATSSPPETTTAAGVRTDSPA